MSNSQSLARAPDETGAQRDPARQSSVSQIAVAIAILLLGGVAMPILAQDLAQEGVAESETAFESLRQEAMLLKQDVLTASESEGRIVADTASKLFQKFDQRIELLQQKLAESRTSMSETARRYSDDLMTSMFKDREQMANRLAVMRGTSNTAWEESLYRFSKAFESFCESWEDVEANLDPELS